MHTIMHSLNLNDTEAILRKHGEIHIRDEICNRDYRFSPADVAALFASPPAPTLH